MRAIASRVLVAILVGMLFGTSTASGEEAARIRITAPVDGSEVPWRPIVEGTVSDPESKVWVIVHPLEVSKYWVQPPVTVREGGTWKVQIYIGEPGGAQIGKG